MPLTVAVRPDHDADVPGRVSPALSPRHKARRATQDPTRWLGAIPQARSRSTAPSRASARAPCCPPRASQSPRLRHRHRAVQRRLVVAGVIHQAHRRGVGDWSGVSRFFPPHSNGTDPAAAHLVDHPLLGIGRLGTAAPGTHRRSRVGETPSSRSHRHAAPCRARHQRAVQEGRRRGREVRQIRPHIRRVSVRIARIGRPWCQPSSISSHGRGHARTREALRPLGHPFTGRASFFAAASTSASSP